MSDNYETRAVAVYEMSTDRLVAIFPTWEACKSLMPFPSPDIMKFATRAEMMGVWDKYTWLYADERPIPNACNYCGSSLCDGDCDPCSCCNRDTYPCDCE